MTVEIRIPQTPPVLYWKRQNETANLGQFRHLQAGEDTDAQSLRLMRL
jgi:hypothetical protein